MIPDPQNTDPFPDSQLDHSDKVQAKVCDCPTRQAIRDRASEALRSKLHVRRSFARKIADCFVDDLYGNDDRMIRTPRRSQDTLDELEALAHEIYFGRDEAASRIVKQLQNVVHAVQRCLENPILVETDADEESEMIPSWRIRSALEVNLNSDQQAALDGLGFSIGEPTTPDQRAQDDRAS
jgi:hypothetical protein